MFRCQIQVTSVIYIYLFFFFTAAIVDVALSNRMAETKSGLPSNSFFYGCCRRDTVCVKRKRQKNEDHPGAATAQQTGAKRQQQTVLNTYRVRGYWNKSHSLYMFTFYLVYSGCCCTEARESGRSFLQVYTIAHVRSFPTCVYRYCPARTHIGTVFFFPLIMELCPLI